MDNRTIEELTEAIKLNPNDGEAYISRGQRYSDKKSYDKAVADYNRAIEIEPHSSIYILRGNAYLDDCDRDRALTDYSRAIEIEIYADGLAQAYFHRGMAYSDEGEYDRAISDFDMAIELDPEFSPFYYFIPSKFDYTVNARDKLLSSFPRKRESIAPGWAEHGDITPNWY